MILILIGNLSIQGGHHLPSVHQLSNSETFANLFQVLYIGSITVPVTVDDGWVASQAFL